MEEVTTMNGVPEGFELLSRTSPLVVLLGPFYARGEGGNLVLGLRVAERHTNARGFAHGGVLLTLADVALGYAAEGFVDPPARLIMASVSADFARSARLGDWVEARVDVQKVGGRMAFANAYLHVGDRRVARASAVFARAQAKEGGEA
jgi:acyl-coenzyme A thioesterase 13